MLEYEECTHITAINYEVERAVDDNEKVGNCHNDVHLGSPDVGAGEI